jgi:hypothetical protein
MLLLCCFNLLSDVDCCALVFAGTVMNKQVGYQGSAPRGGKCFSLYCLIVFISFFFVILSLFVALFPFCSLLPSFLPSFSALFSLSLSVLSFFLSHTVNGLSGNGFVTSSTSSGRSILNNNQTIPTASSSAFPVVSNITRVGQSMTIPKGQVPPELAATLNDTGRIFSSHSHYPRGAPRGAAGGSSMIGRKRERSRSRTRSPSSLAEEERPSTYRGVRGRGGEPRGAPMMSGRVGRGSSLETSPPSVNRSVRGRSPGKTISDNKRDERDTGSHATTSAYSTTATSGHKSTPTLSDPSTLTHKEMIEEYNLPGIHKNTSFISISDLIMKYPKLYIPADFTSLKVDWNSIMIGSSYYDFFFNLSSNVPIVFENTPVTMKPSMTTATTVATGEATNKEAEEGKQAEGGEKLEQTELIVDPVTTLNGGEGAITISSQKGTTKTFSSSSSSFHSDILEPTKYSYVTANTSNNNIINNEGNPSYLHIPERFPHHEKPVKFNAKVLVCCGLKDPENERIDHNYTRKLRFVSFVCLLYLSFLTSFSLTPAPALLLLFLLSLLSLTDMVECYVAVVKEVFFY